MDPLQQFVSILQQFLGNDNEVRQQAEKAYQDIDLPLKASLLLQVAKNTELSTEIRSLALVLLRRLLANNWEELWPSLDAAAQEVVRNELLALLQAEPDEHLRRKVCDVVAEVARNHLDDDSGDQKWATILQFLTHCLQSTEANLREVALNLFENVPGIFGTVQSQNLPVIKDLLMRCMQDQNNNVRSAAIKALASFLVDNDEDAQLLRFFGDTLPTFLQAVDGFIETEDDQIVLQSLVDIAGAVPKFLRPRVGDFCQLCLKAIADKEKEDTTRQTMLEAFVTLAENSAAMVRKDAQKFIPEFIKQCLALMIDMDDDDNWAMADEAEDEDMESNQVVGETSLDRLAIALGGRAVLTPCLQLVNEMLKNNQWQQRYAGLMAISTIGEGCEKQMEPLLGTLMESIILYLQDPQPRVRYACCNCLGQMATDFQPGLQKRFHDRVVPALLKTLEDPCPRVQAHAGAAIINFVEDCPKPIIAPYLDSIMAKLEWVLQQTFKSLLDHGKKHVLEQIITTIASIADVAEGRFTTYYDRFLPCLKYILEHANDDSLKLLKGKTIECISLIGLAVGKELFYRDAQEIMRTFLQTQEQIGSLEVDDPQVSYMISAWARICKIMGKDFQPYLPVVMPAVMKTASIKPEVAVLDSDEAKAVEDEDEDWQFVNLGEQQSFGVKTAGMEEKATACQMLVCYARELKEGFADYVEEVCKLMVSMLRFYFHDEVRSAAAESLPVLLECAKCKGNQFVVDMWAYIVPDLFKAIEMDPEPLVLADHMQALADCIDVLGQGCLTDDQMKQLLQMIDKKFEEYFKNLSERIEKQKDEDYDEETEHDLINENDDDVSILSKISDIFHALFSTHKEAMVPYFEHIIPHVQKLLVPGGPWQNLQWGICLFDDLIEFGGEFSIKYQHIFLEPMLKALADENPEVRQAAAYGFGIMGLLGGNAYAQTCSQALPLLVAMINLPGARATNAGANATENAIAAVTKILHFNSSMIDANDVIPHWLQWLPVYEDKDEAPYVYRYLCQLVESNHPAVLGDNNANLPKIFSIIAEALLNNALEEDEECRQRMINLVKTIQQNPALFNVCIQQLNQEQMVALQEVING